MLYPGRRGPSLLRSSATRNGMQAPSSERSSWRGKFPWTGILTVCIVISISVNVVSFTLHKYQTSLLNQLKFPSSDLAIALGAPGRDSEANDLFQTTLFDVDGHGGRRLSSGHSSSSSASASQNSGSNSVVSGAHSSSVAHSSSAASSGAHSSSVAHSSSAASGAHSAGGSCHASAGGHHGPHPHDALLSLFNALVIGAGVMQLSARYPMLQQTIVLFVIGFISSLCMKGLHLKDEIAVWGDSYEMWMDVDPHLLLFTLLPALLAGDAMTIDTSVARQVGLQCLYLAGPGVLIGAFSTAFFLDNYIVWESSNTFVLSLCAGSILCATDPVAVVALLKELGASPMLTVQIQGESLLNDGTAIVLYLISYDMLSGNLENGGKEYDALDMTTFLLEKAVMAFALGLFIGYFFFGWIRAVSNKLDHSSSMIQITLTICCAYVSFIFVEGMLGLSGVLATVASSLVLAHHMWPYIVSPESLNDVWHTIESLGNIIVFFLAGSLTGFIVLDIDPIDFLNLIVIYVFLLFVRGTLLFASRPILQYLHAEKQASSWEELTLMTWGGLRGAVGLALAIQVNNGRAPNAKGPAGVPQIHEKDAQRLLFFVSGIAFLTTLVNAATAPWLVKKLGITALPAARQKLLKKFHQQLVGFSESRDNDPDVTESLRHMLHESFSEIEHQKISKVGPRSSRNVDGTRGHLEDPLDGRELGPGEIRDENGRVYDTAGTEHLTKKGKVIKSLRYQSNDDLIKELQEVASKYDTIPKVDMQVLGIIEDLPQNTPGNIQDGMNLIRGQWVDIGMSKVVNSCFLTLVYNHYWKLIEEGKLRPGSQESELLLTSVRLSLSPYRADLVDFHYLQKKVLAVDRYESDIGTGFNVVSEEIKHLGKGTDKKACVARVCSSSKFNGFIAVVILLNSVAVIVEELGRNPANNDSSVWIIMDGIFTFIFVAEFVLKFAWLKCAYFKDGWNRFDFALVIVGVAGLVLNILEQGGGAKLAGQTRVMRLARVLRTMRFLRVFRLFHARLSADKYVSMDLAKHMHKITILSMFITAHIRAQNDLVCYFGGNGKLDEVDEVEIARCMLQSHLATYKALISAAETQAHVGEAILHELFVLHERKSITEALKVFVEQAHKDGALSPTEAHAILHPLNDQVSQCMASLNDCSDGVISGSTIQSNVVAHRSTGSGDYSQTLSRNSYAIGTHETDKIIYGSDHSTHRHSAAAILGNSVPFDHLEQAPPLPPFGETAPPPPPPSPPPVLGGSTSAALHIDPFAEGASVAPAAAPPPPLLHFNNFNTSPPAMPPHPSEAPPSLYPGGSPPPSGPPTAPPTPPPSPPPSYRGD